MEVKDGYVCSPGLDYNIIWLTSSFFLFRHHSQAHPTWPDSPKDSQRSFDGAKIRSGKQKRFKSHDYTDPDVVTVGMSFYLTYTRRAAFSCLHHRSSPSRLGGQACSSTSCGCTARESTYHHEANRRPPRSGGDHKWKNPPTLRRGCWPRRRRWRRKPTLKTTAAATAGTQQLSW